MCLADAEDVGEASRRRAEVIITPGEEKCVRIVFESKFEVDAVRAVLEQASWKWENYKETHAKTFESYEGYRLEMFFIAKDLETNIHEEKAKS